MSVSIKLKHSSTASKVPTSGDLTAGELGLNLADEKIYMKNADGDVVQVAGPGNDYGEYVKVVGDNMTGNLTLGTDKITLNATSGNVFAGGAIASTRFDVTTQLAAEETINGETKQFAFAAKNGSNVYRAALDYSGNLALGDDAWSTPNINLKGSDG